MAVEEFDSGNSGKPFYQVWIDAVTKPNVENFKEIVNDPNATLMTAILWLAGVGFINSFISGVIQSIFGTTAVFSEQLGLDVYSTGPNFPGIIFGAFASIFLVPIGALIGVGIIQLVSRMLGGTGSFEKLFYGFAAFWVPTSLVNALIGSIPVLGCLGIVVMIYALVLGVFANQAVHEYETWKAVVACLVVPILVLLVIFGCILVLVALGVATAFPIFENIIEQIGFILLM